MIKIKARQAEQPKLVAPLKPKDPTKFRSKIKPKEVDKFAGCYTNDTKLLIYLNQFQRGKITLLNNQEIDGYRKVSFGVSTYYDKDKNEIPMINGFLPLEINTFFHQ